MTWTKIPDDFPDRAAKAKITDAAYRMHVDALVWSNKRELDGQITNVDVRRFAEVANPDAAITELVALKWWAETSNGWRLLMLQDQQVESAVIEKRRQNDAARQRRLRMRRAGLKDSEVTP